MKWELTPVFSPGKSHGQRSLVGYSPWGHKESDMTERLSIHAHMSYETADYLPLPCTAKKTTANAFECI